MSPHPAATDAQAAARTTPVGVTIEEGARRLSVAWEDGHSSVLPWWSLRGFCPCAACQGHGRAHVFHPVEAADAAAQLTDVREVGNYALALVWRDGHVTGIYPFDLLRALCPCADCRREPATLALFSRLDAADRERLTAAAGA